MARITHSVTFVNETLKMAFGDFDDGEEVKVIIKNPHENDNVMYLTKSHLEALKEHVEYLLKKC